MIPLPTSIESERLLIRPFTEKDRDGFLAFMTDPEATRHLMFTEEQRTKEGAQALLEVVQASYATEQPVFAYAIALKEDNAFIGSCGLSELGEAGQLECYYSLLPPCWGQGYATEATTALLRYCFEHDAVKEVWAFMSPDNPRSAGVAKRVGMEERGIREHPVSGSSGLAYVLKREERGRV